MDEEIVTATRVAVVVAADICDVDEDERWNYLGKKCWRSSKKRENLWEWDKKAKVGEIKDLTFYCVLNSLSFSLQNTNLQ